MWFNAPINGEIIKFVQSFSNPFLDYFFIAVTMLGGELFFTVAILGIYWCIDKKFGYKLAFVFLTNGLINTGIKDVLKVPRPIGEAGIRSLAVETAEGYSFPSGHSQNITSFWVSIILYAKNLKICIGSIVIILLVAFSRVYLGVHRPVDIIAGIVIGFIWILIGNFLFDVAEKTGNKSILLVILVPALCVMYALPSHTYYKLVGMALGFYTGYIVEPRYINYQVKSSLGNQILKVVIGLSVLLSIRILVKLILPVSIMSDFIRYFLLGIWATIGAPFVFKKYFTDRQNTLFF